MKIQATKAISAFKCLQDQCPDTCCKGWSMQVDDATFAKYQENNLENAVSYDGNVRVMKRDKNTDFCVKFQDGICSIHKEKGDSFLGDACNFYPRITRKLGDETLMTATLSCPEIVRLTLLENNNLEYKAQTQERLPTNIIDWLPNGLSTADALIIHQRFLQEAAEDISAETLLARIYAVSETLDALDKKDWAGAVNFMFKIADGKLLPPEKSELDDYNIFQSFLGILHATNKKPSERLLNVIKEIEKALGVEVNFKTLMLTPKNLSAYEKAKREWKNSGLNNVLKNYIVAQISAGTLPFGGMGKNFTERAQILIFKFALIRLALMASPNLDNVVDMVQPICRIMDHLSDATLTLNLMEQFGMNTHSRLMGVILG